MPYENTDLKHTPALSGPSNLQDWVGDECHKVTHADRASGSFTGREIVGLRLALLG
jgi:hypothetical protein